jgi:hypothetical protein
MLASLGPRSREQIHLMLRGIGLSEAAADEVLTHGVDRGALEVDPADPSIIRAVPRDE